MTARDTTTRMGRIAVIIVNYGTADLAIKAVESVLGRSHGGRSVSVHLVDNASPGDDARILQETHAARGWDGKVTFWPERENHGFARGNNVVLKALAGADQPPDAVFLLNPDARLENEAIDLLARDLETTPRAAAAGACLMRLDGSRATAAFRFPGPVNEIARMINLGQLNHLLRRRLVPMPPYQPAGPVDWVSGASVIFRFEALREVDFFDSAFFLYFEEVDLMRRLTEKGWQVLYQPEARVLHEEGVATGQFVKRAERRPDPDYLYQSWRHYFSCAYGRAGALTIAVLMVPAALVNILHRGIRGQKPTLPADFLRDHYRHVVAPLLFGTGRE